MVLTPTMKGSRKMNYISKIISVPKKYKTIKKFNNTAYIEFEDGNNALFNLKTSQILGEIKDYSVSWNNQRKLFYQVTIIDESKSLINIYDTSEEKFIVNGWEFVKKLDDELLLLKSPIDNKLHLFDTEYRAAFEEPIDGAEVLFNDIGQSYLSIIAEGKQGLYHHCGLEYARHVAKEGMITQKEFDGIEAYKNIFVYTKDNQKFFSYIDSPETKSIDFDDITVDKEKEEIVYCKKGNMIFVYDAKTHNCLFSTEADEIKLSKQTYREFFTIKKGEKMGICIAGQKQYQLLEPQYDKIEYLDYNYFALYKDGLCDIGTMSEDKPFTPLITGCEITEEQKETIIYKKNGKYGAMYYGLILEPFKEIFIPPIYDRISSPVKNCLVLEQNNKKGLAIHGKIVIPCEYDEVTLVGDYGPKKGLENAGIIYAYLRKGDNYRLARLEDWRKNKPKVEMYTNITSVQFLPHILVLKTKEDSRIYNYEEQLLNTYPADTEVSYFENKNSDIVYSIDGLYYSYNGHNLEEVYKENMTIHSLALDTGTEQYIFTSRNLEELQKLHSKLTELADALKEKTLYDLCNQSPTITLTRKPKKNE